MAGKILVSVAILCFYISWAECGTCLSQCLYSVISPTCSNGGSTLRYNLNSTTNLPSSLDMCGTQCSNNERTRFYLVRQPASGNPGSKVVTIHVASDCRYAIAAENSSIKLQNITKVDNRIPTKFLFQREVKDSAFIAFKSINLPRNYLALSLPDQAGLSLSGSKTIKFIPYDIDNQCTCSI